MTVALYQSTVATTAGSATTSSASASLTNVTQNLLYVSVIVNNSNAAPTVSDTNGNTYAAKMAQVADTHTPGRYISSFVANAVAAGANIVTAQIAGNHGMTVFVAEVSGQSLLSTVYDAAGSNSNGQNFQAPPFGCYAVLTTVPPFGELILSTYSTQYANASIGFTCGGGFTVVQTQPVGTTAVPAGAFAWQLASSNATYTTAWSDGSTGGPMVTISDCLFAGNTVPEFPAAGAQALSGQAASLGLGLTPGTA